MYTDTRASMSGDLTFTQAIVKGLAPGGGLLVPRSIPSMELDEILELASLPYAQRAARIYKLFDIDVDDETIDELMSRAYGTNFDDEAITPIATVAPGMHVMELWHGPTSAFKDMALQCLPLFFSDAVKRLRKTGEATEDYLILVATSGDTGKAALEGFRDRDHTSIMVFYPNGGVSDIQFKQMATQLGGNVYVLGGRGDFDDCQTSVKRTFNDTAFNDRLKAERNIRLSSANSINWGRLMPQIVYYISAYAELATSGAVEPGKPIDICVPTGNFGNILGAYYAKRIGTPIERLVCASNDNRVLTDFIGSGVYDIRDRKLVLTPSPSMDILVSSNLERQLFELTDRDGELVRSWMESLMSEGCFEVDAQTHERVAELYAAGSATNEESLATIRRVLSEHGYLMDPHTAVAWKVASENKGDNPMLVVSTAHWAKFGYDVYRAIKGLPAGSALPEDVAGLTGVELNRQIASMTGIDNIPAGLDALDDMELRFTGVCDATCEGVEKAVEELLG
ncbi:MAG: threonine synthase [Coriobacteriales bacterium]